MHPHHPVNKPHKKKTYSIFDTHSHTPSNIHLTYNTQQWAQMTFENASHRKNPQKSAL